jgi:hypothetical protein
LIFIGPFRKNNANRRRTRLKHSWGSVTQLGNGFQLPMLFAESTSSVSAIDDLIALSAL